jgi:hypothetical protein
LSRWSVGLAVIAAIATIGLGTAVYRSLDVAHPPDHIQSMGHSYTCDSDVAYSRRSVEDATGHAHLRLVGWVPITHGVYAVRGNNASTSTVYLRFGRKYFACSQQDRQGTQLSQSQ